MRAAPAYGRATLAVARSARFGPVGGAGFCRGVLSRGSVARSVGGYREGMSTDPDDRTPDHDQDAEPPTPDGEEPDTDQLDPETAAPASDPDPAPEDV